jgi:hypothetical protein
MQSSNRSLQTTGPAKDDHRDASSANLQCVACGQAPLGDALQILAQGQEELIRLDSDLRERETWVVTAILARSEAAWELLAKPTLRFALDRPGDPLPYHLEVGRYAHLAALLDITAGEQELLASSSPTWARVYPHLGRHEAGQTGALAQSYVPITTAEAVATLGIRTIVSEIENAVRMAGSALRAQAECLNRRKEGLEEMERALGWDDSLLMMAPADGAMRLERWLALMLLGRGGGTGRILSTGLVGILITLLCLLFNPVLLWIALPSTIVGVLICALLACWHLHP